MKLRTGASERVMTRFIWIVIWVAAGVALAVMLIGVLTLLGLWPAFCVEQASVLGAVASSAGALAMFLTVLFIKKQAELQSEQLSYYYRPGVWLQIDYDPAPESNDPGRNGVGVKLWSANQATLFGVRVDVNGDKTAASEPSDMVQMPRTADGRAEDREKVLEELHRRKSLSLHWECARIAPDEEWWCLLGPVEKLKHETKVVVKWTHVTEDEWIWTWKLRQHKPSLCPKYSEWSTKLHDRQLKPRKRRS